MEEVQKRLVALNEKIASLKVLQEGRAARPEELGQTKNALTGEKELKKVKLKTLEEELLKAKLSLQQNRPEHELTTEIAGLESSLTRLGDEARARGGEKERLLQKLSAYLYLLNKHSNLLESELAEIGGKLSAMTEEFERNRRELERLDKDRQKIEFKLEQDPLEQIEENIKKLDNEKQKLEHDSREVERQLVNGREPLTEAYRVLTPLLPEMENRLTALQTQLGETRGQINAGNTMLAGRSEEKRKLDGQIAAHPSPENYRLKIEEIKSQLQEMIAARSGLQEEEQRLARLAGNFERAFMMRSRKRPGAGRPFLPVIFPIYFVWPEMILSLPLTRKGRRKRMKEKRPVLRDAKTVSKGSIAVMSKS